MTKFRVTLAAAAATCMSVAIGVLAQQAVFRGTADAVRVFITVTANKEGRLVVHDPDAIGLRSPRRRQGAADHGLRQHAATGQADRHA